MLPHRAVTTEQIKETQQKVETSEEMMRVREGRGAHGGGEGGGRGVAELGELLGECPVLSRKGGGGGSVSGFVRLLLAAKTC
jgi:hypothetical protein